MTQSRERLAVIDLGSNSFRLVVFMARGGWWRRTDEIYEPVRIGEGLAASGRLGEEPMRRALATLDVFDHFCRAAGLSGRSVDALATSAIRDAENAAGFLALARERTSLPIRVLSREEEARYGYLAAVNSTTLTEGCVLDLGGGSLQLVRVVDRVARELGSWRLGAVRMTEDSCPPTDPPSTGRSSSCASTSPASLDARSGSSAPDRAWWASAGRSAISPPRSSARQGCPRAACRG